LVNNLLFIFLIAQRYVFLYFSVVIFTLFFFRYGTLDDALAACLQRQSGLAQRRLTLPFMRATNVHFRTAFSAELLLFDITNCNSDMKHHILPQWVMIW